MALKCPYRNWILVMVYLAAYINYAYTVNIALSIISMVKSREEKVPECLKGKVNLTETPHELPNYGPRYDWNEYIQSLILGAYFWSHCIFALPAGAISEYWGPAKVIFWSTVAASALNSLSVPAAWWHYGALIFCRFLLGVAGALVYPALQDIIAQWAPPAEKGKFVAGLLGNTLSTVITWPLVGHVTSRWGWNWGFHALTFQMLIFCVIFFIVADDNPEKNRFISAEEVAFIQEAQGGSVYHKKHLPPLKQILVNVPFWVLCILHFGNLWGLYVQLQSVPKFMADVVGFNLKNAGVIGALPSLIRLFMSLTYGFVGDYLTRKGIMSTKMIRKGFVITSHIIPGILMSSICFVGCNWKPIIALLTLSMSINGAVVLTNLQNPQDLAPNFAGTIFGIMTFIAGTTGFIVPSLTAVFIAEHSGLKEWSYTFIMGGCMYFICGIIFILFGSVEEQSWNKITAIPATAITTAPTAARTSAPLQLRE